MTGETCRFGHTFEVNDFGGDGASGEDVRSRIRSGEIDGLEDLKSEQEALADPYLLRPIMGDYFNQLAMDADSQGLPYNLILASANMFDEEMGYEVHKTKERVHISPQSQMHQEFMQRKQQAEQNVKQTSANISELRKQKHMLEHDLRKLRSRVEAVQEGNEGDEARLKADFIEMVDGAMGQGQGQGDEASMKFLQNQNIYPSITADFTEMESLQDLKPESAGGTGKLAQLPENEKAVLKKKWAMYEKWKDLFGSEVKRRLQELKEQHRQIERAIEETKDYLEPYVRDATTLNQKTRDELAEDMDRWFNFKGYSSQFREVEFVCSHPLKKQGGYLYETNEEEATHYKVVVLHCIHVNLSGDEDPRTPAQGPSTAKVFAFPAVVCRHIFERIFEQKIEKHADEFKQIMQDYTGEFQDEKGEEFQEARQDKGLGIRDLRRKVDEKIDENVPLEFSAMIRRIEDGVQRPEEISDRYGEEYLKAINELLGKNYGEKETKGDGVWPAWKQGVAKFTGLTDEYYVSGEAMGSFMAGFEKELEKDWFLDTKQEFGMYSYK